MVLHSRVIYVYILLELEKFILLKIENLFINIIYVCVVCVPSLDEVMRSMREIPELGTYLLYNYLICV